MLEVFFFLQVNGYPSTKTRTHTEPCKRFWMLAAKLDLRVHTFKILIYKAQDVAIIGDNVFKEDIELKWGHQDGP